MANYFLSVDIGNTDTVVGVHDSSGLVILTSRLPTHHRSMSEVDQWLWNLFQRRGISLSLIQGVGIASVVPQANLMWEEISQSSLHQKARFLNSNSLEGPLELHVDRPEEVGADRIANAVALWTLSRSAGIVMDFGTATTFDVVTPQGHYVGGVIAPGLKLALESLAQKTALLPRIALQKVPYVIGHNTVDAMSSGGYWGYISLVEGLHQRVMTDAESRFGGQYQTLATGGLASLICSELSVNEIHIDENLTLKGILYGLGFVRQELAVQSTISFSN